MQPQDETQDEFLAETNDELAHLRIAAKRQDMRKRTLQDLTRVYVLGFGSIMLTLIVIYSLKGYGGLGTLSILGNKSPSIYSEADQLESLALQITKLNDELSKIKENVQSNPSNADTKLLTAKVASLEDNVTALNETIKDDTDKALTSKLLREKQKDLEAEVSDLKSDNRNLRDKVDGFLSSILTIPIMAALLSALGLALAAGIGWIRGKFFTKPAEDK